MQKEVEPYKNTDEVAQIEWQEAVAYGVAAKSALEAFQASSKHWKAPHVYGDSLAKLRQLTKDWREGIRLVENARDCIHKLGVQGEKAVADQKKNWHEQKQPIIVWLENNTTGLPPVLSKVYGEIIYAAAVPPEPIGVPNLWTVAPLLDVAQASGREDVFGDPPRPVLVLRPEVEESGTFVYKNVFQEGIHGHYQKLVTDMEGRRDVQTKKLLEENKPTIYGTVSTENKAFPYNGSGSNVPHLFNVTTCTEFMMCVTKRVMFSDLRLISNPIRAHPMWLTCYVGKMVVVLVPPHLFLQHMDLVAWLKGCETKHLGELAGAMLSTAQAIYIPEGWVPLWMGLPSDVDLSNSRPSLAARGKPAQKKEKQALYEETCCAGFALAYETGRLPSVSEDLKTRLYGNLIASKIFPSAIRSAKEFDTWHEACKPPETPSVAAAGAEVMVSS